MSRLPDAFTKAMDWGDWVDDSISNALNGVQNEGAHRTADIP